MDRKVAARQGITPEAGGTVKPLDVTVLMGGPSDEGEISLLSGTAIADGLMEAGHGVVRADITPQDASALDRQGIDVVFIALHGQFGSEQGEIAKMEARDDDPFPSFKRCIQVFFPHNLDASLGHCWREKAKFH